MTALVPIEPGQWVLAFEPHCFDSDLDMRANLERLQRRGAGWDSFTVTDIFQTGQASRVMPKTYLATTAPRSMIGTTFEERRWRELVIAAASTEGQIVALRDKLFSIGHAADDAIEREADRLIAPFAAATRAAALDKVHAALPHIFGRSA